MSASTVHINLGGERESHAVVDAAELFDLRIIARFLMRKLVTGKTKNDETFVSELLVELLQAFVLRRESTLARGIHNQYRLACEVRQVDCFTTIVRETQIVQ